MSSGEFDLIKRYFSHIGPKRQDVTLGVGDDCALLLPPENQQLAVSMDTLVLGRHFTYRASAESVGHKSLAVNLSDLAAMGAEPAWASLALTLPEVNHDWLAGFASGFSQLAEQHGVQLVGGDTTRGPLSITVQVHGFLSPGTALRRDAMRTGDLIYVTGTLGDAGLALMQAQGDHRVAGDLNHQQIRLDRPIPRVEFGQALAGWAHAAIDISDGLIADLGHICEASRVGVTAYAADLPVSAVVRQYVDETSDWWPVLAAGDDYELCFTVSEADQCRVEKLSIELNCPCTLIGRAEVHNGLRIVMPDGSQGIDLPTGFNHFPDAD